MSQQNSLKDSFIESVMGGGDHQDAYYDDQEDVNVEDGTYPAIVIDLTHQDIITRKNVHCDLYKPTYEIAKGNHKGQCVTDKGIWRFRSNPSPKYNKSGRGNIIYKNILDIFDIPLEDVEVDGKKLKRLPELTLEKIQGKTVLIDITNDTYKSNYGKISGSKIATLHGKWEDGSSV